MAGLEPDYLAGAEVIRPPEDGKAAGAGRAAASTLAATDTTPAGALAGASLDEDLDADMIPLLEDELLIEVEEEEEEEGVEAESGDQTLEEAHQSLAAEDFSTALDEVHSMEALPDIFFRFGVPYFKSVALFKVQGGMVMGWRGAGLGILSELIRGIVVPVQSDTFLARGIEEGPYAGPAGSNPVEERIAEQLGAGSKAQVVTAAVKLGERPVLVVCGLTDTEEDASATPPDPEVVTQLGQLCDQASQTVLRLIMERKQSKQPQQPPTSEPEAEPEASSESQPEAQSEPQPEAQSQSPSEAGSGEADIAATGIAATEENEVNESTGSAKSAKEQLDEEGKGSTEGGKPDEPEAPDGPEKPDEPEAPEKPEPGSRRAGAPDKSNTQKGGGKKKAPRKKPKKKATKK
jgi:hypothetical protein